MGDGASWCRPLPVPRRDDAEPPKNAATQIAVTLGDELDMEPNEALLVMLRRAAALQAYWRNVVAELEPDQVVVEKLREREWSGTGENGTGGGFETIRESHAELHIALRAEREAMQDVVKFAKTALDAGSACIGRGRGVACGATSGVVVLDSSLPNSRSTAARPW